MFHRTLGKQQDFYMIIDDEQIIFQKNLNCDNIDLMEVGLALNNTEVLEKDSCISSKYENNRIVLNVHSIKDFIEQFKNVNYPRDYFKIGLKMIADSKVI